MANRYTRFGLSEDDLTKIIEKELEANADILIGIDDPEVQEMINVLKNAIAKAISANNQQLERDSSQ